MSKAPPMNKEHLRQRQAQRKRFLSDITRPKKSESAIEWIGGKRMKTVHTKAQRDSKVQRDSKEIEENNAKIQKNLPCSRGDARHIEPRREKGWF